MEGKRYREFTVTPGITGFKVKIGCSEVYFSEASGLSLAITSYLSNPQAAEKEFLGRDMRFNGAIPTAGPLNPYETTPEAMAQALAMRDANVAAGIPSQRR